MAKILIVDDDPDIVLSVRLSLESAGHQVIEAPNASLGLELLKDQHPDLLILDVMMDTPTEGFELAEALHKPGGQSTYDEFRDLPILMLTSVHNITPLDDEPLLEDVPVDLFVDKPIDPDELVDRVSWLLNRDKY